VASDVLVAQPREERPPARQLPRWLAHVRWPLIGTVVVSAAVTIWFVLQCVQYFIQPDELEYLQQSRQIWSEFHPLVPSDAYFNSWSQLQPVLLSPVWGLFHDTNTAHKVMGVVNALLMVSTAFPAYLLAKRVIGDHRWAYLVAFLSVFVPWMAAASTMMTEVAAYPAFVWGVLCVQRAVARPSGRGDLIGLGGVVLAYLGRPQLAVLGAGLVAGVVLQELRYALRAGNPLDRRRDRLKAGLLPAVRRHRWAIGAAVVALILYVVVHPNLFGGYSRQGVAGNALNAPGLWMFARESLAYVVVGVAIVPLAMAVAWALQTLWRPLSPEQHAFAIIALVTGGLLVFVVGGFTARYTPQGINSRYVYYLCPLLFTGMVALVADRRAATVPLLAASAAACWLIYGATISQTGPSLVSPDQTFHVVLAGRTAQIGKALGMPLVSYPHLMAVVAVIVLVVLAALRRTRWARGAGVLVLAGVTLFCVAETAYSMRKIADTQKGVSPDFISGRRWIDAVMPPGQKADVIASSLGDPASSYGVWWDTSFWNRTTGRTMQLVTAPDLQQPFPLQLGIDTSGHFYEYTYQGKVTIGPYVVKAGVDRSFGFRGAVLAAEHFGVQLLKIPEPAQADWMLTDTVDDTGKVGQGGPESGATVIAFARTEGESVIRVRMTLGTWSADGVPRRQRYAINAKHGTIRGGKTKVITATLKLNTDGAPFIESRLRAPGKANNTRGIQVLTMELLPA
jgi:hypothetical protein